MEDLGGGATTSERGPGPPIKTLLARWQESERQLYPLALSTPERYERSVSLVRALADVLRAADSSEKLATRFGQYDELVTEASTNVGIHLGGLDLDAVAGAAFALRHADLEARAERAAALARVAAARREHREWAILHESGPRREDGTVLPPYHLVEAYLPRACGLHASALHDVDTDLVVYRVEAVRVDLDAASWWTDEASPLGSTCGDVRTWAATLAEARTAVAQV